MKKYWPVLCLAVISIIGLGIYYIGIAKANSQDISFHFETLEGDESYLNNLVFETSYNEDNLFQNYSVSQNEATRIVNHNFLYENNKDFLNLFEDNKNFFRAKAFNGRHFYNDEQSLAYVYTDDQHHYENANQVLYEVDRLNRETEKREKVNFIVEIDEPYDWQTVEWVNNQNNELQVLSNRINNSGENKVILTTFDFEKNVATEQVLMETSKQYHIRFHHQANSYNELSNTVISQYRYTEDSEGKLSEKLYYYDVENGLSELNHPDNDETSLYEYSLNENYFIAAKRVEQQLQVKLYNLQTKQWGKAVNVELSLQSDAETPRIQLLNDELYVLYEVEKGFVVEIVNINSAEKLYSGLLTAKNSNKTHHIFINRVYKE